MSLPAIDSNYLADRGVSHQVSIEAGMICVVFPNWSLPDGYTPQSADLLLRLASGYPDVPPDMWWFSPGVRLTDGRAIQCTEVTEAYLGRTWQRWSRHFPQGVWRSGVDSLESFLALIRRELARCAKG